MATTTLAVVDAVLKEVYEPRLTDQLQSDVITRKRIKSTAEGVSQDLGGKYVVFPIRTRRNHGIGARAENSALPVAQSQKYAPGRVSLAYLYGAAELTGQTMELAEKDPQSFISVMDEEINGLKENLAKDMNRQTYGTSAGILGTAASGTATTFVLPDAQAKYFELGMQLDIFDTSAAGLMANAPFTVDAIASAGGNTTITFSPAAGAAVAAGDTAHRSGSKDLETIGFKEILGTTNTLYNINPATESIWKAVVDTNGGVPRAISEGLMIKMADKIAITNGGKTTVIFTTDGVNRAYFQLLSQQRRFNNTKEFTGGFSGLPFVTPKGEIPIVVDADCQAGRMCFMNEEKLKIYMEHDFRFMNRDGSNWQRKITSAGNFDAYQTMMYSYQQLGTTRRNTHGLIDDITEAI